MAITRKALLISNPGEAGQENYCKGVYVDIDNYRRLLTSAEGGAWEDSEITVLDRPMAATVRVCLVSLSLADYGFVMFTGHGWYSKPNGELVLQLKQGEDIAALELKKGAKKRTIIFDCCQKVYPDSFLKESRAAFAAKSAEAVRQANRVTCRRLFDQGVQSADMGILVLNSCSVGELSSDRDNKGAYYAGSLVECVDDWSNRQSKMSVYAPNSEFSCVAAHNCASVKTKSLSGELQNPTIEKPKTMPYFPIAVFG